MNGDPPPFRRLGRGQRDGLRTHGRDYEDARQRGRGSGAAAVGCPRRASGHRCDTRRYGFIEWVRDHELPGPRSRLDVAGAHLRTPEPSLTCDTCQIDPRGPLLKEHHPQKTAPIFTKALHFRSHSIGTTEPPLPKPTSASWRGRRRRSGGSSSNSGSCSRVSTGRTSRSTGRTSRSTASDRSSGHA